MSYKPSNVYIDLTNSKSAYSTDSSYPPSGTTANHGPYALGNTFQACGQQYADPNYVRFRTWMNFNLPTNYMTLDAVLHLRVYSKNGAQTSVFQVRRSTAAVPPLAGDFGDYGTVLDSVTDPPSDSDQSFDVDSSYLSSVMKFMLTTDRDIDEVTPTGNEYYYVYGDNATYKPYLTIQVPEDSKAPTNVGATPTTNGTYIEATGIYNAAGTNGNTQLTYIRIQISDDAGFSNILKDTGQVAYSPIDDGESISKLVEWFPSSAGTYYIRIATWDDDNHMLSEVWGSSSFTVSYPTITSLTYTQNKEKYKFTAVIEDSYSKPPRVTLTVGNKSYVMNIVSRTGSYVYTYTKTVELEVGDYEYHIEVGNVWKVLIGDDYFLHAHYRFNNVKTYYTKDVKQYVTVDGDQVVVSGDKVFVMDPLEVKSYKGRIDIYLGDSKLNAWDIILQDNLLPETSTINFNTDTYIGAGDINVVMRTNNLKKYVFIVSSAEKEKGYWKITATSKAKEDFDDTITFGAQIVNSLDLLKTILPDYYFRGDLEQNIVYQQYLNEPISNILSKLLILNNKVAYERNKTITIKGWTERTKLVMHKNDPLTTYREDRTQLVNSLREYYTKIQYPLPDTALTNYASTLWTGTVADAQRTGNYLLAPSNSLYMLKGTGEIYASVDFLFSDYDNFNLNWNPDSATSLEVRLETDSSNYYSYSRAFSGGTGSGFIKSGANSKTDEVSKSINFTAVKISYVQAYTTQPCKIKMQLKLSGAVVETVDFRMTNALSSGTYRISNSFSNTEADELVLTFTNLYVVSGSYGVNCYKLDITKYVEETQQTGTKTLTRWEQKFIDKVFGSATKWYLLKGESTTITGQVVLGAVPTLIDTRYYKFVGRAYIYCGAEKNEGDDVVALKIPVSVSLYLGEGNKLTVDFSVDYTNSSYYSVGFNNNINYSITAQILETIGTFETVWVFKPLAWASTYNLWDNIRIPLSAFTKTGNPTNQINTIRLNATSDNYYDKLFVKAANPQSLYVDVEDIESIDKWKKKYKERKLDGWNSEESATAFAEAFVDLFKNPITQYSKSFKIDVDADLGDIVVCDGTDLQIYRIVYNWESGLATVFAGRNVRNTVEFLKSVSRRIETLERI